ncbi:MAG: hypothetical protein P8R02_00010 [Pseudomonadales bacterium]|nr:hypothetical protein [Pseudomonadales bacterium]
MGVEISAGAGLDLYLGPDLDLRLDLQLNPEVGISNAKIKWLLVHLLEVCPLHGG